MTRPIRRRHLITSIPPEPLPTCVAAFTDDVALDRYRATLLALGWTWKSSSPPLQQKEKAA